MPVKAVISPGAPTLSFLKKLSQAMASVQDGIIYGRINRLDISFFKPDVSPGDQPGKPAPHADGNETGCYGHQECVEKRLVKYIFAVFTGKNRLPVECGKIPCCSALDPHEFGRMNPERIIDDRKKRYEDEVYEDRYQTDEYDIFRFAKKTFKTMYESHRTFIIKIFIFTRKQIPFKAYCSKGMFFPHLERVQVFYRLPVLNQYTKLFQNSSTSPRCS